MNKILNNHSSNSNNNRINRRKEEEQNEKLTILWCFFFFKVHYKFFLTFILLHFMTSFSQSFVLYSSLHYISIVVVVVAFAVEQQP